MKNIFIINPTAGKKDCTEAVRSAAAMPSVHTPVKNMNFISLPRREMPKRKSVRLVNPVRR